MANMNYTVFKKRTKLYVDVHLCSTDFPAKLLEIYIKFFHAITEAKKMVNYEVLVMWLWHGNETYVRVLFYLINNQFRIAFQIVWHNLTEVLFAGKS